MKIYIIESKEGFTVVSLPSSKSLSIDKSAISTSSNEEKFTIEITEVLQPDLPEHEYEAFENITKGKSSKAGLDVILPVLIPKKYQHNDNSLSINKMIEILKLSEYDNIKVEDLSFLEGKVKGAVITIS